MDQIHSTTLSMCPPRHAFSNTIKIETVYNANNRTWQGIHDSITTVKKRKLFDTDFIVQSDHSQTDSPIVNIQVNKHCTTELLLLDNTKVLCLFDTGSNVNLISESVIKSREYLSSLPILDCPDYMIRNTTSEINVNKFIELCFRVKDDFILNTTALVVPDFSSVKFLFSISSVSLLKSVIDVSSRQISIRKKSFVFKTSFHNRVKAQDTMTIGIKCSLPKQLRNGNFVAKPFRRFSSYLPLNFMLQFKKGKSYLKITNPTSKGLTIKAGTLGCVSFELIRDLSQCANTITHLHQDMDGSSAMCSLSMSACPINHPFGIDPDIAHYPTCQKPYNHSPQSLDYPTCAESLHMSKKCFHHSYYQNTHSNEFSDNQLEIMMQDYYSHNQDKMSPAQIRELKVKTFLYLIDDDVRLCMSDRNIIRKELDLKTDSVLSDTHKHFIRDFFYSMRDNPSVQNKSYVSLKPVNLKLFYIKPYLTYE